jgi:hypothetical protein
MADTKERRKTPRKTATPKPDTTTAAPRKGTAPQRAAPLATTHVRAELSPEETRRLIAEAAYFRAKQRGFAPGREVEDWIAAESEVMGRLNGASAP